MCIIHCEMYLQWQVKFFNPDLNCASKSCQESTKFVNASATPISNLDPKIVIIENNHVVDFGSSIGPQICIELRWRCAYCRRLSGCSQSLSDVVVMRDSLCKCESITNHLAVSGKQW